MAFYTSSDANKYTIVAHADLDLPNGQWAVGIWAQTSDLSGTSQRIMVNFGGNGAVGDPAFRFGVNEDSYTGGSSDRYSRAYCYAYSDNAAHSGLFLNPSVAGGDPVGGGDATWRLFVAQRTAAQFELWQCALSGAAVLIATQAISTFTTCNCTTNNDTWYVGCNTSGVSDWKGNIGDLWLLSGASLTQANIETIAAGAPISTLHTLDGDPVKLSLLWSTNPLPTTETDLSTLSHHATKVGSPTFATHPYSASTTLYGRPTATVTNTGSWTASSGSLFYDLIDEVEADDTDYIQSPTNPSAAAITIPLTAVTDPGSNTVKLVIRHKKV